MRFRKRREFDILWIRSSLMTLIVLESFDLYNSDQIGEVAYKGWNYSTGSVNYPRIISPGRTGGNCCQFLFSEIVGSTGWLLREVATSEFHQTFTLGFAFRIDALGMGSQVALIFGDTDACFGYTSSGSLYVQAGPGFPVVAYSENVVPQNVWMYIDFSVTLGSPGSVTLRVNDLAVIEWTGSMPGSLLSGFQFQGNTNNYAFSIDDLYLTNGAGINNGIIGDMVVLVTNPAAVGDQSLLKNSDNTYVNNWDFVNSPELQYTTFVESGTPGDEDTYEMSPLAYEGSVGFADHRGDTASVNAVILSDSNYISPTDGTIFGVQIAIFADKNNTGFRMIIPVIREDHVDYLGTAFALGAGTPIFSTEIFELEPATSTPWTVATVNAAQLGVRIE